MVNGGQRVNVLGLLGGNGVPVLIILYLVFTVFLLPVGDVGMYLFIYLFNTLLFICLQDKRINGSRKKSLLSCSIYLSMLPKNIYIRKVPKKVRPL